MHFGSDRNYVRLCGAVDGFRVRYGRWPTTARLWPGCIEVLRGCLSDAGFAKVEARLRLVEDEEGRSYDYGSLGFPPVQPDIPAGEWLAAELRGPSPEAVARFRKEAEKFLKENPDVDFVFPPDA